MLTFELDENQTMIRQMVQRLAQDKFAPEAAQWDTQTHAPKEAFEALFELGMLSMTLPESEGGFGLDMPSLALVFEAIAYADAGLALALLQHNCLAMTALQHCKTQAAKDLIQTVKTSCTVLSYSKHDAWNWIIEDDEVSGAASCIVAGRQADVHVFATNHTNRTSLLAIGAQAKGVEQLGRTMLGMRSAGINDLDLDDVALDAASKLTENLDLNVVQKQRPMMLLGLSAIAVGVGRAALDEGLEYGSERKQFGKRLVDFQVTKFKLADMATDLEASRLMMLRAADAIEQDAPTAQRAATQAATRAQLSAARISDEALQIHGGYGYTREYPVERLYRDARILPLWIGEWR